MLFLPFIKAEMPPPFFRHPFGGHGFQVIIATNNGYAMIYVDILAHLHGQTPFEDVLEDVFGPLSRPHIDGCDGPCAVGHPMGCARVSKQTGDVDMVIVSCSIPDLTDSPNSFDFRLISVL